MGGAGGDEEGRIRAALRHAKTALPVGALGPGDDAAVLPWHDGDVVWTTDAVVEGVHFLPVADPWAVGRFVAAVNLSDLAAMGAAPRGFLVAASVPPTRDAAWADQVAAGLADMLDEHACPLLGGDTKEAPPDAPATFVGTALGAVPSGAALRRDAARPGDHLLLTGTLGGPAAALALHAAGRMDAATCMGHVLGVRPHLAEGVAARGAGAHAAVDLSDGLARAARLLAGPGRRARLPAHALPVDAIIPQAIDQPWWRDPAGRRLVVGTGGEYGLLVAVPDHALAAVEAAVAATGTAAARVGRLEAAKGGPQVVIETPEGEVPLDDLGWRHFAAARAPL